MDRSVRKTLVAAGAAALTVPFLALPSSASPPTSRTTLPDSAPVWATAANDAGPVASSTSVTAQVYLAPAGGEAALDAAVAAVSTPGNASYQHYLTVAEYEAQFGPTADQIAAVSSWLTGAGLSVTGMGPANRFVIVTGDTSAVQSAFGTALHTYRHNDAAEIAPSSDVTVPSELSTEVLGVTGLSAPQRVEHLSSTGTAVLSETPDAPPPDGFVNGRPCSEYYGQIKAEYQADYETPLPEFSGHTLPYAVCGYVPSQFRSAYGVDKTGLTGAGVTVAITDAYASPTIVDDANTYATKHGDLALGDDQYTEDRPSKFTDQDVCGPSGWYGEQTLDVEAVHGVAVDADIAYYASASCYDDDFLNTLQRVVDDNIASYVSNSWGDLDSAETSGQINAYEQVFEQGALQGIGFLFSSGDSGDNVASSGLLQTDYPASDPNVTAVGGTSTNINQSGRLGRQSGWGTEKYSLSEDGESWVPIADNPFLYGAGGGYSALFNRPDYQDGVVPDDAPPGRAVPDIALDADPTTGMLIGETQTFPDGERYGEYRIGGTSLAAPLMAGIQALASEASGVRFGFLNPRIYDLARTDDSVYRDVDKSWKAEGNVRSDYVNGLDPSAGVLYSVRTFGDDSSLQAVKGWDDVTGVGSPRAAYITAAP